MQFDPTNICEKKQQSTTDLCEKELFEEIIHIVRPQVNRQCLSILEEE